MTGKIKLAGKIHDVAISARDPDLILKVDGQPVIVEEFALRDDGSGSARINGQPISFQHAADREHVYLRIGNRTLTVDIVDSDLGGGGQDFRAGAIRAPMPGVVVDLNCEVGDVIETGALLLTIESMKLQTEIRAPIEGQVERIAFQPGETFDRDALLITLEATIADAVETGQDK